MEFGKQSLQGYESNRRHADGVRVENIPRNHNVGLPREDSKSYERPTGWTWALQWQDHLHVNVQWHCLARRRKQRKMWIQFADSCELCSQIPSRSLVFLGTWIRREMVRNLHWQNPTDHGIKLQRTWWRISQDPVIQHFVPPVPLREENYEAKEGARSQHTSMVVMKTSSCFSARWFLRISSVSSEP